MPKISVIVPVYKAENTLHRCVDSILAQTFTDFELLLIDDGSPDRSGAICDEYEEKDPRVKVFHKPNGGVSSARNLGLDNAVGEWVSFVDSDDWIEENYIEELHKVAVNNKADVVICGFRFVFENGKCSERFPIIWDSNKDYSLNRYLSRGWTTPCASIQKKDLYVTNCLKFPENISCREDFHLMTRLCFFAKQIVTINAILYNYLQQQTSLVHAYSENRILDEQTACSEIIEFFKSNNCYETYKQTMAWITLKICQDMVLDKSHFKEFNKFNPDKKKYIWNCPNIGFKIKVLSWLVSHRCAAIATIIINFRKILSR